MTVQEFKITGEYIELIQLLIALQKVWNDHHEEYRQIKIPQKANF